MIAVTRQLTIIRFQHKRPNIDVSTWVSQVASTAATNLSFLYFLQGEVEQAEKYAELARESDSYNPAAFVNLGNCHYQRGDLEKAKELYVVALDNDASCVEALYNLGLCNKEESINIDSQKQALQEKNLIIFIWAGTKKILGGILCSN